jgi:restriction system protein
MELFDILMIGLLIWGIVSIIQARVRERRLRALQLADIDNMTGIQFEHYVAKLLTHQGYKAQVTVASRDFGIDVIAQKQAVKYAIQVKRQVKNISRRAVSDAVAGKFHYNCTSAMVVTNVFFTSGAQELAKSTGCRLVDRDELAKWILAFQQHR